MSGISFAQDESMVVDSVANEYTVFDDRMLLEGYAQKYDEETPEILLEMIKDDGLSSYKMAAALQVLRTNYGEDLVGRQRKIIIQHVWRRLHRSDSPFVQVEAMLVLLKIDRYRYFAPIIPLLIQKLDHYNRTVNWMAFEGLMGIAKEGTGRAREARIVFNVLRKMMFLSRNRLKSVAEPSEKLQHKLDLLRWSIKVLGTQELKRLPQEVLPLL